MSRFAHPDIAVINIKYNLPMAISSQVFGRDHESVRSNKKAGNGYVFAGYASACFNININAVRVTLVLFINTREHVTRPE